VVLVVRDEDGTVTPAAQRLVDDLVAAGVRARLDAQTATAFGRRATNWELKGVPIRIEVGPRDLAEGRVVVVRRDLGDKVPMDLAAVVTTVPTLLEELPGALLETATARRDARTVDCADIEEAAAAAAHGFARLPWSAVGPEGIERLGRDAVTVRCLQTPDGDLPSSDDEPGVMAIVARSY
jgi:prolyl-tRNA synthetase